MRAIVIREPGGPDVLTWTEVPDPVPGPGEVLVDVVASAVNRADLLHRAGFYDPPPDAPPYPGSERAVDRTPEDSAATELEAAGGRGVARILDILGAAHLPRNVAALARGGRLVVIGLQGGRTGELDLGQRLHKQASVAATTLRPRPRAEKAKICAGVRAEVWPLVESGRIRPVIDRRLPMSQAARAHELVEQSAHLGKVLLVTGAE